MCDEAAVKVKCETRILEAPTYSTFSLGMTATRFVNESAQDVAVMVRGGADGHGAARAGGANSGRPRSRQGSRGMGTMQRMLHSLIGLGSVSEYVASHVVCPVVIVKPPQPQQA